MTQANAPGDPVPHPGRAEALEGIKPYAAAAGAVALLGAPAEVAVPIVRRLRGRSGVSTGPGLMNLANGAVALGVTHHFRRHPAQWERWQESPLARWGGVAGAVHLVLSPAVAARWEGDVVFRRRSPLWGGLFSPIGLVQVALTLGAVVRARRARSAETPESSGH